jgi:hypothetical protein
MSEKKGENVGPALGSGGEWASRDDGGSGGNRARTRRRAGGQAGRQGQALKTHQQSAVMQLHGRGWAFGSINSGNLNFRF